MGLSDLKIAHKVAGMVGGVGVLAVALTAAGAWELLQINAQLRLWL